MYLITGFNKLKYLKKIKNYIKKLKLIENYLKVLSKD
jgi:hypothetical protein